MAHSIYASICQCPGSVTMAVVAVFMATQAAAMLVSLLLIKLLLLEHMRHAILDNRQGIGLQMRWSLPSWT